MDDAILSIDESQAPQQKQKPPPKNQKKPKDSGFQDTNSFVRKRNTVNGPARGGMQRELTSWKGEAN